MKLVVQSKYIQKAKTKKHKKDTTKKSAYRGGFEKLKTASIDYQTASIDMSAL
jgi:hypothetical protein